MSLEKTIAHDLLSIGAVFGGINANQLRGLAMFLMLLDHLWATLIPGNIWMTYLGRLAFPIFAFQISEGFSHTSDRKRYAKRLFLFGLIAEVPFDLIYGGTVLYPFHQNVMFTLLLGLLACCAIDRTRRERTAKAVLRGVLSVAGILLLSLVAMVDYGWRGVLTVVAFYAVFSLLPIWLYNGQRGRGGKALQYAFYSFYPVHMLVLYLLFALLR